MSAEDLARSERASQRAAQLMEMGELEMAFASYQEAAEYMMSYLKEEKGQRKAEAQKLTELLLIKAHNAKQLAAEKAKKHRQEETDNRQKSSPQNGQQLLSVQPHENRAPETRQDNRSAIRRDIENVRKSSLATKGQEFGAAFVPVSSPNVCFSDIAGLEEVKNTVRMKVIEPILHPELFHRFGKTTNGGILLYGPPGTGKTMIARAIATETKLDFFSVRCSDIVGKSFGDGERNLKALFDAARASGNAMIFFDEFESLACRRGSNSTIMNRIVPELLSQMDGFLQHEGTLICLASTNRPWDLDTAVLRPPRMTEKIYVGLPDPPAREYMVRKALEPLPLHDALDYGLIAETLEGFNCADIAAFIERVKEAPIRRGLTNRDTEQFITAQDVDDALAVSHSSVQKSDLEALVRWEATQQ